MVKDLRVDHGNQQFLDISETIRSTLNRFFQYSNDF